MSSYINIISSYININRLDIGHNWGGIIIGCNNWKLCRGTHPDTKEISECTYIIGSNSISVNTNINIVGDNCIDEPENCMQLDRSNGGSEDRNIAESQAPMMKENVRDSSMDCLINLLSDMSQSRNYDDDGNIYLRYHYSTLH